MIIDRCLTSVKLNRISMVTNALKLNPLTGPMAGMENKELN